MKPLNTFPIEDFLDRARVAIKSNQKVLTLTIKEVTDLQNSLVSVMARLSSPAEPPVAKANNLEVKMDGGKF